MNLIDKLREELTEDREGWLSVQDAIGQLENVRVNRQKMKLLLDKKVETGEAIKKQFIRGNALTWHYKLKE